MGKSFVSLKIYLKLEINTSSLQVDGPHLSAYQHFDPTIPYKNASNLNIAVIFITKKYIP